jgi:hypothetical protein
MSIKALIESIEQARTNNTNTATAVLGKLNEMIQQIEHMKVSIADEFAERDRDLIRLMEGAA